MKAVSLTRGGGQSLELEPAQGGGVHQGALGQGLSSYGEHPCADIGQSFQRNGGQRGPAAAAGDREVLGRKRK